MNNLFDRVASKMKKYPYGSQSEKSDPLVIIKLFDSFGSGIWYLTEFDEKSGVALCYVEKLFPEPWCDEWGTVSIHELSELQCSGIPRIEIDRFFKASKFSDVGVRL